MSNEPYIMLYLKSASLSAATISALRKGGVIPVLVNSFDDVRMLAMPEPGYSHKVFMAAIKAIHEFDSGRHTTPRGLFGSKLCEALIAGTADAPKSAK